jgi:hypothetical protein
MLQTQRSGRRVRTSFAALGVSAGIVVVALAGRAPLSRSAPLDASSARAPVTALLVLFVGAAIVALAALATLIWPGRQRKRDDEPEFVFEAPQLHWIWKLLAILLPIALGAALVAAAVLGAKSVHHTPGVGGAGPAGPSPRARPPAKGGTSTFALPDWLPWTALAIVLIALALVAALLALRRGRTVGEPEEASAARAAVDAAIGALDTATDPRSAVIAAYAAMERTLGAHGVTRSGSEAPREYLRRVLAQASQTEREARTLTGLFEEARFSAHPIPERTRELALAALSSLRARLGAVEAG